MGTKFAPFMANLFMAKWEKDIIYTNRRPELIWRRYIDDVLLLWDGDMQSFCLFMEQLNDN